MAEQSHRDEMNAAIKAQRARQAVPRSMAPAEQPPPALREPLPPSPEPEPAPEPRKSLFARLRRK